MNNSELSLMAHLMRRAGFGASRDELETRLSTGYEVTVDELNRSARVVLKINPIDDPLHREPLKVNVEYRDD